MRFGEKLSFLRKKQGMTQLELAEKLDISRQAVSRWEQGTSEPSTENLVSIGKLFGVPVDDLVNESVQLQTESTAQVAVAEVKEPAEKRSKCSKYDIAKIVGLVILFVAVVLAVCVGMRKEQKESKPMDNFDKDAVKISEAVTLPIDLDNGEGEPFDGN